MNREHKKTWAAIAGAALVAAVALITRPDLLEIPEALEADSSSPVSSGMSTSRTHQQLDELSVEPERDMAGYDRALFPHWDTNPKGNCTTRQVVLERDGQGVQTDGTCQPTSGTWESLYDDQVLKDAGEVDVDHLVALGEAWRSGADTWTTQERQDFANDLDSPQLWAVSASSNRSKGDADPAEWMPPARAVHCRYVAAWVQVKHTWSLSVDQAEERALREVLDGC